MSKHSLYKVTGIAWIIGATLLVVRLFINLLTANYISVSLFNLNNAQIGFQFLFFILDLVIIFIIAVALIPIGFLILDLNEMLETKPTQDYIIQKLTNENQNSSWWICPHCQTENTPTAKECISCKSPKN